VPSKEPSSRLARRRKKSDEGWGVAAPVEGEEKMISF
jgi:hypothetical protein